MVGHPIRILGIDPGLRRTGWGLVDDVIDPRDTRRVLAWGLELARSKKVERPARKRGVIPV